MWREAATMPGAARAQMTDPSRRRRKKNLPFLPKADKSRVALARRLRREMTMSLKWVAQRLHTVDGPASPTCCGKNNPDFVSIVRTDTGSEFAWQGSWVETNIVYYVYDGNLVIQERDANNLSAVTYTRGKDLGGRLEGAGGIGGLLARTSQTYADASMGGNSFYHADGSGNIAVLLNSANAIVARYCYDAFGNIISKSGLLADANVYRFSSKEWHPNSGIVYYLYRNYDPKLQRWLNRDPLGELGFELVHNSRLRTVWSLLQPVERFEGPNLYEFIRNNSLTAVDLFGLAYGNPVSGPVGPIGPSDPYAPGGPFYCNKPPCQKKPADSQDGICTFPVGLGYLMPPGITACCAAHDNCYFANGCHSDSWGADCGTPACKQCNANVLKCVAKQFDPLFAL